MINQKPNIKNQEHKPKTKNNFGERCYSYSIDIIKFANTLPEKQACKIISSQLLCSATSIGANFIEAKAASFKRDYVKYFETSLKSANETKYWLGLLRDVLDINETEINKLLGETIEISNTLAASLLTMKNKKQL